MAEDVGGIAAALDGAETVFDDTDPAAGGDGGEHGQDGRADGDGDNPDDAGGTPLRPNRRGYSAEKMNERYALVLMGSTAVILDENPDAPLEERHAVRSIKAFSAWHANRFTQVVVDGKIKETTWSARWLSDRKRRQYCGIVFHPAPDERSFPPHGYYNLWKGFSYEPRQKAQGWAILADHIRNHVCQGRDDYYRWILGWMAHIIQRPRERVGTAIVLRGKMGTGKTVVGEAIGALIASHYFLVDDPRYVTGQFNAHMASCLLLQAEEAVWAGDKAAEGRLKGLITSKFQMIEAKGVDPIRLDNFVRLIMTSNEGWVVPAGKDERRFAVFDVSDAVAQNSEYFREMAEQLRDGGYEALLYDLMQFDLSTVDLRKIPRTGALLEQKIRSLDSVESWWFERLKAGTPTRKHRTWPEEVSRDGMFEDYLDKSDKIGIKRRAAESEVGMALAKLVPALDTVRRWMTVGDHGEQRRERMRLYRLPPLAACRQMFEEAVGQAVDWEDPDDPQEDEGPS